MIFFLFLQTASPFHCSVTSNNIVIFSSPYSLISYPDKFYFFLSRMSFVLFLRIISYRCTISLRFLLLGSDFSNNNSVSLLQRPPSMHSLKSSIALLLFTISQIVMNSKITQLLQSFFIGNYSNNLYFYNKLIVNMIDSSALCLCLLAITLFDDVICLII